MKLDIFKSQWLDIVFEGRNKSYGAYELRKSNPKTSTRAMIFGSIVFGLAVSAPLIMALIPESSDNDDSLDTKITTVKLPPKQEKPKENMPPPPPPPPKVDQVKFVKPVVAKADEVTEEPPKIEDIKEKKLGSETIKGDPGAELTVEPVGNGPSNVVEDDNNVYSSAGLEIQPSFPGGFEKLDNFISKNINLPEIDEEQKKLTVIVSWVVEKDGSITDVSVLRDPGYGLGKEAIRLVKKFPKFIPGEQNGRKVRSRFQKPITVVIGQE